MKFVLTGITGFRNRGVDALVTVIVQELKTLYPNAIITILTETPDFDSYQFGSTIDSVKFIRDDLKRYQKKELKHFIKKIMGKDKNSIAIKEIKSADCVIATGGDVFSSDYGRLNYHLYPLKIALHFKIPFVFLAHSIGPFRSETEIKSWMKIAKHASLITLRESISHNYITDTLGLKKPIIKKASDAAFLLKIPETEVLCQLKNRYISEKQHPLIAIAPSKGISFFSSISYDLHRKAWINLVEYLIEILNAKILLIPHVQNNSLINDDRILATEILKDSNWDHSLILIGANHTASELKGLISQCDMVIAERMHAAIAGLGCCCPTLAVGYSVKAEGIIKDILGEAAKKCIISINEFINQEITKSKVNELWESKEKIADLLKRNMSTVQQCSKNNFSLIVDILKQKQNYK